VSLISTIGIKLEAPGIKQKIDRLSASFKKFELSVKKTLNPTRKAANNIRKTGRAANGATPAVRKLGTAMTMALGPMALIGGAIGVVTAGFKTLADQDFAEAKGWIQPNEGLTFDDKQLLEQLRTGTPPPIHDSQIGDMSLQEFERKVPMDFGKVGPQSSTHDDFMNV